MPTLIPSSARRLPHYISGLLLLLAASAADSAAYTSRTAFQAAVGHTTTTVDFDNPLLGSTFASGTGLSGLTFTYTYGSVLLRAHSQFPAPSGTRSLGTTDADVFQDGDNLRLTFSARNAIGLSIITSDPLQAGDLELQAGSTTASLVPVVQQTLSDGAKVYFLGIVQPGQPFTSATLTTVGGGHFFFNLDDITSGIDPDADADGILNAADNCTLLANPTQVDSNGDGFGNRCDGDLNNNGATNAQDTVLFRRELGRSSPPPTYNAADLNANGAVNAQDTVLHRQLLGSPPGPAGALPFP